MASGKANAFSSSILDSLVAGARIALCMTSTPSASSAATGLTTGGGYTAGGELIDLDTAVNGVAIGPASAEIEWTNSSGSTWAITGLVIHTAGASHPTAAQMLYFNDFSANVPDGGALTFPIDSLTFTEV